MNAFKYLIAIIILNCCSIDPAYSQSIQRDSFDMQGNSIFGIDDLTVTGDTTLNAAFTGWLKAAGGLVSAQSSIGLTSDVSGVLPIANGGTNSSTALSNNRVMVSNSGSIKEASGITASRAVVSDTNGIPTHSTTTSTQIGYLDTLSSNAQTQLDSKVPRIVSVDNKMCRFDGTTGAIQGTNIDISDLDAVSGITSLAVDNLFLDGNTLSSTNTNGPIILQPNGDGTIQVNATGNTRGIKAVDLQFNRTAAANVASGSMSFNSGTDNRASGANSGNFGGTGNIASSDVSTNVGGGTNTCSGVFSLCLGGTNQSNSGSAAVTLGGIGATATHAYSITGGGGALSGTQFGFALGNTLTATGSRNNVHFEVDGDDSDLHIGRQTNQSAVALANNALKLHTINASNQANYVAHKASTTLSTSGDYFWPAPPGAIGYGKVSAAGLISWETSLTGLTNLEVDNLKLDGNVISSTNTNGNVTFTPNGTGLVEFNSNVAVNSGKTLRYFNSANTFYGEMTQTAFTANRTFNLPNLASFGDFVGTTGAQAISGKTQIDVDNLRLDGNTLSVTNSNGALILSPNGNGAVQVNSTGNTRGTNAVDLQFSRTSADRVASGSMSFLAGTDGKASGPNSTVVGGTTTNATADVSTFVGGGAGTCSGIFSTCIGGVNMAVSGYAATGIGGIAATATHDFSVAMGGAPATAQNYGFVIGNELANPGSRNYVHFEVDGDDSEVHIGRQTNQSAKAGASNTLKFHTTNASNQQHYTGLKASSSLTASATFVLPPADGTSGQVIKTDGSKNLSFASVSELMPVGFIMYTGSQTVPTGYLKGGYTLLGGVAATASRTTYATLFNEITFTQSCTTTNGSVSVTTSDTSRLLFNVTIEATGVTAGSTVASVTGTTTFDMDQPATASGTVTCRFLPWGPGDGSTTFTLPECNGAFCAIKY